MVQTRSQTEKQEEVFHVEDFHWQGDLYLVEKNDGKEKRMLFCAETGEVELIGYVMPNGKVVRIEEAIVYYS